MKRLALVAVVLALVACGGDDDGPADFDQAITSPESEVPDEVVEAVQAEYPDTNVSDIAFTYQEAKVDAPDASDDDIVRWMLELLRQNAQVETWNECLERSPTGEGCDDPGDVELSPDNPLGA